MLSTKNAKKCETNTITVEAATIIGQMLIVFVFQTICPLFIDDEKIIQFITLHQIDVKYIYFFPYYSTVIAYLLILLLYYVILN